MRRLAAVLGVLVAVVTGGPAGAHLGGNVQVALASMTTMPVGPGQWHVMLLLQDQDSGTPAWGMDVTLRGSGPSGAVLAPRALAGDGKGRYEGTFAGPAGAWTFSVHADPAPGGQLALPFDATREVGLGGSGSVAGRPAGKVSKGGGTGAGARWLALPVLALAAGGVLLVKRRRAPVPAVR
ncbi:MAG TPA: hypothetical protein VGO87_01085 [Acidimicrobiia bacterium]|jgi:hypothetical protein